jgi:hypothetical protein
MKTYIGKGLIRINSNEEIQVEYNVQLEFDDGSNVKSVKANLLSPQDAIQKVFGITGTLLLKDGEEIDFFGAENGKLTPVNFDSAIRGFKA